MLIIKSRRNNHDTNFTVSFGIDEIVPSDCVKVLGVTIDSHLTWEGHISTIVARCNCILVSLARLRHKLPKCTRRLLIQALVFPHITYCLTVWGSCTAAQRNRVQKLIHFGARIVAGLSRRDHVTPVMHELGWKTVDQFICDRDIAAMHRVLDESSPTNILRQQIVLPSDVSLRQTRAAEDGHLQLPRVRTEFARRAFMYRAVAAWNSCISTTGRRS